MRRLIRVDLLIIDDSALQPLDALDTADVYELIVEPHRAAATVVTSNRDPTEWLAMMADALVAQSAIDGSSLPRISSSSTARATGCVRSRPSQDPMTKNSLTPTPPRADHHVADVETPEPGPMPLALGWSHQAGARHPIRAFKGRSI
jgi:hypothetical protein